MTRGARIIFEIQSLNRDRHVTYCTAEAVIFMLRETRDNSGFPLGALSPIAEEKALF